MGKHFVLSFRYNKKSAADFGLIERDTYNAIDPRDESNWIRFSSYDFGWGNENGYYKEPLPELATLFDLVLYSSDDEDVYGAASIILQKYPDELLNKCEYLFANSTKQVLKRITKVFRLDVLVNRCNVLNKSYDEINSDFNRWKRIYDMAKKL